MSYWGGGGTLNPASVWYRLARFKKNVFFLLIFFKSYVILKGEHSAQAVYDIGSLGLKTWKKNYSILF